MNDKPQLGVVRVSAAGATFDVPYFAEDEFARMVFAIRATDAFDFANIFIPYRAIDWMVKIPMNTPERHDTGELTSGMTRQ